MQTLVSSIFVFGMLVFFHELGHFIVAKLSDIKVNEFSLGFGPQIIGIKSKETHYSIRILPFGGYVKMEGEDSQTNDPRAFNNKSPLTRLGVILAGPLMNFVLAILLLAIIGFFSGVTSTQVTVTPGDPAELSGIQNYDKIYAIDNYRVNSWEEVVEIISSKPNQEITVTVIRDGKYIDYSVKTKVEPGTQRGIIGIKTVIQKHSIIESIKYGFEKTFWILKMILLGIFQMLTGKVKAEIVGPVGMVHIVGEAAKTGVYQLLYIAAIISANLGMFNLFPVPALDGGRGIFLMVEMLRGKPVEPEKEGLIHFIGFALLMFLMIIVLFKDLRELWI
ncbi:MAG TPA: RIP metalloprotease RseP [Thermoanaerobacterales bacterium]|uniref:RIP metalloprotease RseP n=1 Tax=Tepidanaerobacter sp. GT38 TaxID=2722793 RepID=UPI0017D1E403|nr:RIP metalloprotease RseP [Tepidanaerobacter sp. GT38]MCG1011753.1 RIP metalloprotease RseP [Tepidanaerobacter sp. GT38]HHY42286.1 RIP metalloprotease RseP [Thermoanaerobacterales bacterium]